MIEILLCVAYEHEPWLVLLSALICFAGSAAIMQLLDRGRAMDAWLQRFAWNFLASVAAGATIWCTHFVAMLAYQIGVPFTFDPVQTTVSLLVAIIGANIGFNLAFSPIGRVAPLLGGVVVGLAISAMHYVGMNAYRIDGIVEWNRGYVVASVLCAVLFSAGARFILDRETMKYRRVAFVALFGISVVSLHFIGMTAMTIQPLALSDGIPPETMLAMALVTAALGLLIIAAGVCAFLIDDRVRLESFEKMREMAMTDGLTGLPNRFRIREELDHQIALAEATGSGLAFIAIDLDRFKEINDTHGHKAGDTVLATLGQRVAENLDAGEFIARVGGDEFAAIKRYENRAGLTDMLERLESALQAPIELDMGRVGVGASFGIATYPEDAETPDALTNNADLAMYRAKSDTTRTTCFYDPAMDEAIRERRELAADLREALERDCFELHYQLQKEIGSGDVRGYEALLRWTHPERGAIPPGLFIPVAEENGLILQLGEWVLRRACHEVSQWANPWKVAVNVSPLQLADVELPKLIQQILLESGLSPSRLEIELTETAIMNDRARALHVLRQIKALGVGVALDDFGTGYSSLETLRAFPFDKIKLDGSFMADVEKSPQALAIIRSVLALGKSLSIPVLAEGIERHSQLAILQREGCDEVQGYLLGRPGPMPDLGPGSGAGLDVFPVHLSPGSRRAG
jgi:diguanylate cyclase (GGDEF)-like protein